MYLIFFPELTVLKEVFQRWNEMNSVQCTEATVHCKKYFF